MNFIEIIKAFFAALFAKKPDMGIPIPHPAEARPPVPQSVLPLTVALVNVGVRTSRAEEFAKPLTLAMEEFGIVTPLEKAAFLANGLHETMMLRYLREIWGPTPAQQKYENRPEMGNTNPGDGYRNRGGGFIHLTWGINYEATGKAIGVDLKNHPELIAEPVVACRSAGHYWYSHNLNRVLKESGFKAVVKVINGAYNGLDKRERLFALLKKELGVA